MKEKILNLEEINKKFPIISEGKGFFDIDKQEHISKQLAETLLNNSEYSEDWLLKTAEKNRKEMGLDEINYQRFLLGIKLCDTGKREEALQIFQEIQIFFPENIFVLTEIGDLFYEGENYDNATNIYHTILNLDFKDFNALHKLGMIQYAYGLYDKALQYYLKIQEYYPYFKDINVYIGYAHNQLGNYSKAIEYLGVARVICIENTQTQGAILEAIGDAYFGLGNYIQSEKYFLQSFNIFPENNQIFLKIAQTNINISNYTRAIEYINLHTQNYGFNVDAIYNLGICYYMSGEYIQAEEYFDLLLKIAPEDIDVISCKTYCILMLQGRKEAIAYIDTLLKNYPQKQDLYDIIQDINNC